MKNFISLFILIEMLLTGCKRECKVFMIHHRNLTSQELNFIPYQVGDTLSFTNGVGGVLQYNCSTRVHSKVFPADTLHCPNSDEFQYDDVYDQLTSYLQCQTDLKYNFEVDILESGSFFNIQYPNLPVNYNDNSFIGRLQMDSVCKIAPNPYYREAICLDSIVIDSKKYYQITKFIDQYHQNKLLDTVYYNSQYGVIRFSLSSGEVWSRK